MSEGKKYDEGKQEWLPLPFSILAPLADLMKHGESKYGLFNCLNDFDDPDRRFFNAGMRHTVESQTNPLAKDTESGCYHLAAVAFSALMRLYHCRKQAGEMNER